MSFLSKENLFVKKNQAVLIRVLGALVAGLVLYTVFGSKAYLTPKNAEEFANTSVIITNKETTSGGSGVVLSSNDTESLILTNKHVCRLVEEGGKVSKDGAVYVVKEYKKYTKHDLCLIKVLDNLGVNTKLARKAPKKYTQAYISGHPLLLPHTLTTGNFSGKLAIDVMTGLRKCTDKDFQSGDMLTILMCAFLGGIPVVETFESQLVTGTILPGSSGSGIFNSSGEISGLVFAGQGRELTYAFAVPYEYVRDFVENEAPKTEWKKAEAVQNPDDLILRIMSPKDFKTFDIIRALIPNNATKTNNIHAIWTK